MPLSRNERAALSDLLLEVGPDAPTLCEGWVARDLAAHLVLRDRRPDVMAAEAVAGLAGRVPVAGGLLASHAQSGRQAELQRPWPELVERVRTGPGGLVGALPPLESAVNGVEFFVHHEDVRRAAPDWSPRVLPASADDQIWKALGLLGRLALRSVPVGVALRRPDGTTTTPHPAPGGAGTVTVVGEPGELALFVTGRGEAEARVTLEGDPADVERLRTSDLSS